MSISTITPFTGTVPNRLQSQSAFNTNVADFLTWLDGLGDELVISIPQMNTDIAATNTNATNAATSAALATAAANATAYSGSATYNYPNTVIGSDGHAYRCIDTGVTGDNPVGSTTGDWQQITVDPAYISGRENLLRDPSFSINSDGGSIIAGPGDYACDNWFCPNEATDYATMTVGTYDYPRLGGDAGDVAEIAQLLTGDRRFGSSYQYNGLKTGDWLTISADVQSGYPLKIYAGYGTASGSNLTTTLVGTLSSSLKSLSFQANFGSSESNLLAIKLTGDGVGNAAHFKNLKLNIGKVATPYEEPDLHEELRKTEYFYQRTYQYGTDNGAASNPIGAIDFLNYGAGATAALVAPFKVARMFKIPTVTIYSSETGTAGEVRDVGGAADLTISSVVNPSETGFYRINMTDNIPAGATIRFHAVLDARP